MEMNFDNLLEKISSFLKTEATTETVVGKQFQLGDFSCVPIIKVGMGFGTGGGEGSAPKGAGKGEGMGAGAGLGITPIGFLVTKNEEISFIHTNHSKGLAAMFEKVPELMEKWIDKQGESKKEAQVEA